MEHQQEAPECRTEQRLEQQKGNEQESQFTEVDNGSQADEENQESMSETCEKGSMGTLQLLQFTEGSQDASEWRKEQRLEQQKGNEQESQFIEGENGSQTDEGNQESTSEKCEKGSVGTLQLLQCTEGSWDASECRTEQRLEQQKGNEQESQFTEVDNGSQADEENQESTSETCEKVSMGTLQLLQYTEGSRDAPECRTEQRLVQQKGIEQESQFTEVDNGSQADEENQESTSEMCEKVLMGNLQLLPCTEGSRDASECRTEQRLEQQKGNEQESQFTEVDNGSQADEENQESTSETCEKVSMGTLQLLQYTEGSRDAPECRTEQRLVQQKGIEQESQFTEVDNGSQADEENQESTSEMCEKVLMGNLQLLPCTEGSRDAPECRTEQRLEQQKGNEQESQFTEVDNGSQADEENQESTSETCEKGSMGTLQLLQCTDGSRDASEWRKEQRLEQLKGNEEESQFAEGENGSQTDEGNQASECRTEQRFEEQKGNKQESQFTDGENGSQTDEGNRESTSETCEKGLMGALQLLQCTEGSRDAPECRTEQRLVQQKGIEQESQFTEVDNGSQADEENQESTSEMCEKVSMGTLQLLPCTEGSRDASEWRKEQRLEQLKGNEEESQFAEGENGSQTDEGNQESTSETCEKGLMGTLQLLQCTEGSRDGSECRTEQRFEEQKGNKQASQFTEGDNGSQADEENQEYRNEQRFEEQKGNEQESQFAEGENGSQTGEENQACRTEQRFEEQKGNEQESQFAEGENGSQTIAKNQESMSEKGEKGLMRTLQPPQCTERTQDASEYRNEQRFEEQKRNEQESQFAESENGSEENQGHPGDKWKYLEKPSGNLQESQITDVPNLHQFEQDKNGQRSITYLLWVGVLLVPIACIIYFQNHQESDVVEKVLNIFLQNFGKVQKSFPNQEGQLWKRSRIMLQKHINVTVHSEPSILMFAAAWDAEKTMRCLTGRIAEAYASAYNSRIMEVDGSSKMFLNSDKVKLELDNQLSAGFGEGRKSAVIHHFQDLPPPSTLLFYKYCDHENAAFKDVSLLITVLIDEEKLDPDLNFSFLEETVYDFLVMKFSISGKTGQYNILDTDKFSGLWSRIAHVILPVRPEKEIEENGCKHE
ncbi:uncharacterized protein LOC144692552 [Cetorhinus maximus]